VDGTSNKKGYGAGVVLENLNGVRLEQSLRFAFKASNNQAEYGALITDFSLAGYGGKTSSLFTRFSVNGQPSQWQFPSERFFIDRLLSKGFDNVNTF